MSVVNCTELKQAIEAICPDDEDIEFEIITTQDNSKYILVPAENGGNLAELASKLTEQTTASQPASQISFTASPPPDTNKQKIIKAFTNENIAEKDVEVIVGQTTNSETGSRIIFLWRRVTPQI